MYVWSGGSPTQVETFPAVSLLRNDLMHQVITTRRHDIRQ
jgi:hypothetical protein